MLAMPTLTKSRSKWHEFVCKKRTCTGAPPLRDLAIEWSGMSEAAREAYKPEEPLESAPALARAAAPRAAPSVWPHANDERYPLSMTNAEHGCKHTKALSAKWAHSVGNWTAHASARDFDAPVQHLCEESVGRRRCRADMDATEVAAVDASHKRLRDWCCATRPPSTKWNEAYAPLRLLYIGPSVAAAAGSGDALAGRVLLVLYGQPRCFVASMQPSPPLAVGDVVHVDLRLEGFASSVAVARSEPQRA